jgi:hypothetical protein
MHIFCNSLLFAMCTSTFSKFLELAHIVMTRLNVGTMKRSLLCSGKANAFQWKPTLSSTSPLLWYDVKTARNSAAGGGFYWVLLGAMYKGFGAEKRQDVLTDWPSAARWLWLWLWLTEKRLFPCEGGLENTNRSPSSSKKWQKGNPVPGSISRPPCSWGI